MFSDFESSPTGNVWDKWVHSKLYFLVRCSSATYFHSPSLLFSQVCFDQNCNNFFFPHIRKQSHSFWKLTCRPQLHNFTPRIFLFVTCVRNMKINTSVVCFVLNQSGSVFFVKWFKCWRWGGGVLYDMTPELLSPAIHAFRKIKTISIFYNFWMLVNDLHNFFHCNYT